MKLYILRFVAAAENVYYLVSHTFGNKSSCRSEILTRIEVRRIFCEVTTYSCGAGKSEVGVDIYFADSHACGSSQHIFGNAFGAVHAATEFIYGMNVFGEYGACPVKYDGKSGKAFFHFLEDVETKLGFAFKFVCAVRSSDCYSKAVYAGFFHEFLNLIGIGVAAFFGAYVYVVFDAFESAEFGFYYYAVVVSVINYLFCYANVLRKGMVGRIDHNGRKAVFDGLNAKFVAIAVIEM